MVFLFGRSNELEMKDSMDYHDSLMMVEKFSGHVRGNLFG